MGKLGKRVTPLLLAVLAILGAAGLAGLLVLGLFGSEWFDYRELYAVLTGVIFALVGGGLLIYRRLFPDDGSA